MKMLNSKDMSRLEQEYSKLTDSVTFVGKVMNLSNLASNIIMPSSPQGMVCGGATRSIFWKQQGRQVPERKQLKLADMLNQLMSQDRFCPTHLT